MSLSGDPGLLILVALVACVHATFLLARRYNGPIRAPYVAMGLGFVLLEGAFIAVNLSPPRGQQVSPWVYCIPLLCGLVLASRAKEVGGAAITFLIALLAAVGLSKFAAYLHPVNAEGSGRLVRGSFKEAQELVSTRRAPLPRGFLTPQEADGVQVATYEVLGPTWHTAVTGMPAVQRQTYRIWTPGGPPTEAAAGLRLVLPGDPEPRS